MHQPRLSPFINLNPCTDLASQQISGSCLHGVSLLGTAMDSWHCLFPMHLMMVIRYGNSRNRPTPAGVTHDAYPIICLHSLTTLALPVNTITRECGSLTRPKQPCVSPMVTADVTKGRTEALKFDAQRIICGRAVPYTSRLVLLAEDFGRPYLLLLGIFCWY